MSTMEIVKSNWGSMIVNQDGTKGWGVVYSDGQQGTTYGWVDLDEAIIYEGDYFAKRKSPESVTYESDYNRRELRKGRFVKVETVFKKSIFI